MREYERRRWEAMKADQELIDEAARFLRHDAVQSQYAGLQRQEMAFGLAAVLDECSRHLPDLSEGMRWQVVESCRAMLGEQAGTAGRVTHPQ
jgi:hypothetical protein